MRTIFVLLLLLATPSTLAETIEQALEAVRDVKVDMYERESSTFGQLPSPKELADHQRRARPILRPKARKPLNLRGKTGSQMVEAAESFIADLGKQSGRSYGPIPMGITGAVVHDLTTHAGFYVLRVLTDTPADGVLKENDVILGANNRLFTHTADPRPELGFELAASQSSQLRGVFTVHLVREGRPMTVRIDLGEQTYYSESFPENCAKTQQMAAEVLDVVLTHSNKSLDIYLPLFLLSSQDPEAIMEVRSRLYFKVIPDDQLDAYVEGWKNTWRVSYDLIAFAEYYLMTGDALVLPTIQAMTRVLEKNQFETGSWSHGRPGGYGEINNVGLSAFIALILANECGVEVDEDTMTRAIRFFGRYCGSSIFYGVDIPVERGGTNDNGMPAMIAVAFNLLGEPEMANRSAQSMSYRWMVRQKGHAEATFGMFWQPIGAALGPRELEQMFMDQNIWMYELSRTPDRGFMFFRGSRASYAGNVSAALGSFLYMHNKPLRIMNGEKGALSLPAPKPLAKARDLLLAKQWGQARASLTRSGQAKSDYGKALTQQLDWVEDHVKTGLQVIAKDIEQGRAKTAAKRLDELVRFYGSEPKGASMLREQLGDNPQDVAKTPPLVFDMSGLEKGLKFVRDFAEDPVALNRTGFEGMNNKEVARFLGHCHGYVYQAALQTLVERDEDYAELINEMLADRQPYVRSGAVALIREQLRAKTDNPAKPNLSEEQYRSFMAAIKPALNDEHADVQLELVESLRVFGSRDETFDNAMVDIAEHGELIARLRLVDALGRVSNEKLKFKVARAILRSPFPARRSNNYNNCMQIAKAFGYNWNAPTLEGYALPDEDGLATLNDMAYHGRHVLKGPAGHSDILIHLAAGAWSKEVEELEHMVPAMVQLFVRSQESKNWAANDISRFLLRELFHHVDKDRLRAAVEAERAWFNESPDEIFVDRYNRESAAKSLAELDRIMAGEQTDQPDKGLPIKRLIRQAPEIPIMVAKLRDPDHTRWSMPVDELRLRYERKRLVGGNINRGSKRTGGYPKGADMHAILRAVENTSKAAGLNTSQVKLAGDREAVRDYQNKVAPKDKYVFLVSVTTPRLRYSFGNKFVCLGDAIIMESREDTIYTIEKDQPLVLATAGFYASFDIPEGMEEGSEEWNKLAEDKIGQAFYEQVLIPFAPKLEAYAKAKAGR